MTLAKVARSMQGVLYTSNPCEMSDEDACLATGDRKHFRKENIYNPLNVPLKRDNI
ncbi:MAG: hypothetical protein HDR21_07505 [Lachnospiraceae bacterium]|nr:hypothetical protein [Lachnospiraceae bacterium]